MDPLQRLARLQALSSALAGALQPEDVASAALHHARAALGADAGGVFTVGSDERIQVVRSEGYPPQAMYEIEQLTLSSDLPVAEVLRTGTAMFGNPVSMVQRPEMREFLKQVNSASTAVMPLRTGDRVIGALVLSFRAQRTLAAEERVFLESVALQSAQALARAEMTAALQKNARALALRARASAALLTGGTLEQMLSRCAAAVLQSLDAVLARTWLLDEEEQVLRLRASVGFHQPAAANGDMVKVGDFTVGRIAQTRTPVLSNDALREVELVDTSWAVEVGVRSYAGHPLIAEGRLLGVIAILSKHEISESDLEALSEVAAILAQALLRAEAREEVQESRDHLALILRSLAEGVTAHDTGGRMIFANDAAALLLGYGTVAELIATPLEDRLASLDARNPDGTPITAEATRAAWASVASPSLSEMVIRDRATGGERRLRVSSVPAVRRDGRASLTITVFHDVTEERRQETAWRLLAEAPAALSSSLDPDATLQALAAFASTQVADWSVAELFAEEGIPGSMAVAHRDPALVDQIGELAQRARLQPPGWRTAVVQPLSIGQRIIGELALGTDPEREMDAAELRVAEEVARRASLALDNARLYAAAQEAARVRDIFLSVAAHELRTPLTSVLLLAQALERRAQRDRDSLDPAEVLRLSQCVSGGIFRLSGLVDRLLDVSRITSGRFRLQREDADLRELAREAVARFAEDATAPPITLRADLPIHGQWDRLRVDEIFTNLIGNAVKYGEGKPVTVEVLVDGEDAVIRVRDQGIGIAARDQARIFERFERLVAVRHHSSGLGLGLWIVRQICDAMGGSVSVESAEGEGAVFTVRVPRV